MGVAGCNAYTKVLLAQLQAVKVERAAMSILVVRNLSIVKLKTY